MKIHDIERLRTVRLNPRVASAIALLALSLLAAIGISASANRSVYVWAANSQLAVGSQITAIDIKRIKVFLPENSRLYFSSQAKLIGSTLVRPVGDGEIIPASAVTSKKLILTTKKIPIKIARNDYPADISKGDSVDIYALPVREGSAKDSARLIAQNVTIESIDLHNREIGGEIGIVFRFKDDLVEKFLSETINSKLIVVQSVV